MILYVAIQHDYGIPERGLSFEHYNFYETLRRFGHDILYFDFFALTQKIGFDATSRRLKEIIWSHKPQLTFCILTGDQLKRRTMQQISDSGLTTTVNWYCDDHFNFDFFSRRWTPSFNWVVTTAQCTLPKYEQLGMKNVIKSQWGCNPFLYHKIDLPLKYDVTFVGARHGNRPQFVDALRHAGIKVDCWGSGWNNGRLSQDEMIAVFNQSRINLNFTNGAVAPRVLDQWRMRLQHTWLGRLERSPLAQAVKQPLKSLRGKSATAPGAIAAEHPVSTTVSMDLNKLVPDGLRQIKGRTFEVPGCGGFLMTSNAENLTDYLADDQQAATFETAAELIEKVKHYLNDESHRTAVAQAGYERTMREHTYVHRLAEVFDRVGMPKIDVQAVLAGRIGEGQTEMVSG